MQTQLENIHFTTKKRCVPTADGLFCDQQHQVLKAWWSELKVYELKERKVVTQFTHLAF